MNMFEKIQQLFSIVKHPNGGINYLTNSNASISSFKINQSLKEYVKDLSFVIDVGANIGQYAVAATSFFPNALIYSFEPVPDSFKILKELTNNKPNILAFNCALGDESGKLDFYFNEHSHASSALEVSDYQKSNIPKTKNTQKIQVDVYKLDDFKFPKEINSSVLLKLDVQGFEKKVLEGGTNFLKRVDYLLFETSFIPMYKDEPLFDELHQFVSQYGFEILAPVGILKVKNKILQLDFLYKRVK